jgi:hypothetical protein
MRREDGSNMIFELKVAKYFTRKHIKGNGVLPDPKLFEASINVFAIHVVVYPTNRRIFQCDGVNRTHYSAKASLRAQYSNIPSFQL